MEIGKETSLLVISFLLLLNGFEVGTMKCYKCSNCNRTNREKVTCSVPNITTTTTSSTTSSSSTTATIPTTTHSTTTISTTGTPSNISSTITPSSTTTSSTTAIPSTSITNSTTTTTTTIPSLHNSRQDENIIRIERSVQEDQFEDLLSNDCTCEHGICNCIERGFKVSKEDSTNMTLVCVTDTVTVNGISIVNKGCGVNLSNITSTCSVSGYSANCKICSKNLCNFGTSITASILLLIPAFIFLIC